MYIWWCIYASMSKLVLNKRGLIQCPGTCSPISPATLTNGPHADVTLGGPTFQESWGKKGAWTGGTIYYFFLNTKQEVKKRGNVYLLVLHLRSTKKDNAFSSYRGQSQKIGHMHDIYNLIYNCSYFLCTIAVSFNK
jgi:hypothetical protein